MQAQRRALRSLSATAIAGCLRSLAAAAGPSKVRIASRTSGTAERIDMRKNPSARTAELNHTTVERSQPSKRKRASAKLGEWRRLEGPQDLKLGLRHTQSRMVVRRKEPANLTGIDQPGPNTCVKATSKSPCQTLGGASAGARSAALGLRLKPLPKTTQPASTGNRFISQRLRNQRGRYRGKAQRRATAESRSDLPNSPSRQHPCPARLLWDRLYMRCVLAAAYSTHRASIR